MGGMLCLYVCGVWLSCVCHCLSVCLLRVFVFIVFTSFVGMGYISVLSVNDLP